MKRNKWICLLVVVLVAAVVCAVPLTQAARFVGDVNGDGKVTVFDAQMLRESENKLRYLTESQKAAADTGTAQGLTEYILGYPADIADLNADGVYEIYTAEGLKELAKRKDSKFLLMNDIDLQGAQWTPVVGFAGEFDGNGHTVSNVVIDQSVPNLVETGTGVNMGFFGDTKAGAVIKNLNLQNVTLTAAEDALYMGLLMGSNRGSVENCTVSGTIIDARQTHASKTYIGAIMGRICNPAQGTACGSMVGGTGLSVTDGAGVATTQGLCADVVLAIDNRDNLYTGLVAWYPSAAQVSGTWAGRYCVSTQVSDGVGARQGRAVDYMTSMATVAWVPSQDISYIPQEGDTSAAVQYYTAGQTYYGLPYNRNNGSLERFYSALQPGTNITREDLGSSYWTQDQGYVGFVLLMGNNCSRAVGWSWLRISPVLVASTEDTYHGGVYVDFTGSMIPNDTNRETYGVYPVGHWLSSGYDASAAAYSCTTEQYSADVLATNGESVMLEAYAQTCKADAMVYYQENGNGHARLVAENPVVIRSVDGTIDPDRSYFVITEQGFGIDNSDGDNSTWRVEHPYTFRELLSADAPAKTYLPVTMRALRDETVSSSYIQSTSVNAPAAGQVSSNYRIVSTTLTVKQGDNVIYDGEIFTGVGGVYSKYSGTFDTVKLNCHKEPYLEAMAAAGLTGGEECTFSVTVLLSDGSVKTVVTDRAFTYSA